MQHRNHNTGILSSFKALAVCKYDANRIANILELDEDYFNIHVEVTPDGAILSFDSYSDSSDAFRDLCLAIRDNFPDAHRLAGTFAHDDAFTGEVFEMNYFNFDKYCEGYNSK